MIQISTPTQTPGFIQESGSLGESHTRNIDSAGGSSGIWGSRAQKKQKPGLFAKLLDGITGKGKKAVSEAKEPNAGDLHVLASGNSKKIAVNSEKGRIKSQDRSSVASGELCGIAEKALNKDRNIPDIAGFGEDEGVLPGFSAFFAGKGHHAEAEKGESSGTVSRGLHPGRLTRSDVTIPADTGKAGIQEEAASAGEGKTLLFASALNGSGKGTVQDLPSGDKAKKTAGTASELSRRQDRERAAGVNTETVFSQTLARQHDLRPERGERENSRLTELRSRRQRERAAVEVRDLRTPDAKEAGNAEVSKGMILNASKAVTMEIDLPVELGLSGGKSENPSGKTGANDGAANRGFEDALARELRGNLSTDIVQNAAIIVRNGGEGSIRLSLHPASLGNVKIRLEMTENKITGHIVVESSEALRAFERELPVLEKAFRDSGFSETNLEMSLAQDGSNYGAGEQPEDGSFYALSPGLAASRYESGTEQTEVSSVTDGAVLSPGNAMRTPGRKAVNLLI